MFKRCFLGEWSKLNHSKIYIILMVLPFLSIIIGCANYYFNKSVLSNGWYSLWTQVSLFYGMFFLPVLIAICCAYVCRLEHINKNWKLIMTTPISTTNIFLSKLLVVSILILIVQIFFLILYSFAGKVFGISNNIPHEIFGWIFRGWVASITISTIQLGISIRIRSFSVPIAISICAVFIGLGMYVTKIGMFFPYSLLTIGMGVISQDGLSYTQNVQFYIMNIIFNIVFILLSIHNLKRGKVVI